MNGRDRRQRGNYDDVMAPHNTYKCRGDDQWIAIAVGTDAAWDGLRKVMGDPQWARDSRFATQPGRHQNRDEIDEHLRTWTRVHDHRELAETLQWAGVAAGPVLDSVEHHDDCQLREWGYWWKLDHPEVGERILPGMPVKLSAVPQLNYSPPPNLGQHNREIFGGLLGLTDEEIGQLIDTKVLRCCPTLR